MTRTVRTRCMCYPVTKFVCAKIVYWNVYRKNGGKTPQKYKYNYHL